MMNIFVATTISDSLMDAFNQIDSENVFIETSGEPILAFASIPEEPCNIIYLRREDGAKGTEYAFNDYIDIIIDKSKLFPDEINVSIVDVDGLTNNEIVNLVLMDINDVDEIDDINFYTMEARDVRRRRIKKAIRAEKRLRSESSYKMFDKTLILKEDDGTERRNFKHRSNAERFLKDEANRLTRRNAKDEIRCFERDADDEYFDGVGRKNPNKNRDYVRKYEIIWSLY